MREVRFSIDRDWAQAAHGEDGFAAAHPISNSWGGWPSAVGVAPYLVLRIEVSGRPDPVTGYLVNIQELDRLLRQRAIPLAARELARRGVRATGESLLRGIWVEISESVPERCRLETLRLWTTPYLSYAIRNVKTSRRQNVKMGEGTNAKTGEPARLAANRQPVRRGGITNLSAPAESPNHQIDPDAHGVDAMIELTQCFEFSASHRLHVARLSDEDNRRYFGKCNNPHGHGHNYQVEVTIGRQVPDEAGTVLPLPRFEDIVKHEVIDRLDHTHLNADVPEFAELNPSVENIARTIWSYLDGKLAPATLRRVRVWETGKTYAEYAGE